MIDLLIMAAAFFTLGLWIVNVREINELRRERITRRLNGG